ELRDRREHPREARHPVPVLRGEVRAAVERDTVGREEDRHRPAAVPGHRLHGLHVDRVDVGALLTVDLDVDEALVHEPRDLVVLERLALHDVAPVTGRVADREEDRPVGLPRPGERLLAPGIPVHRVVLVLEEVGARLAGQAVRPPVRPGRVGHQRAVAGVPAAVAWKGSADTSAGRRSSPTRTSTLVPGAACSWRTTPNPRARPTAGERTALVIRPISRPSATIGAPAGGTRAPSSRIPTSLRLTWPR